MAVATTHHKSESVANSATLPHTSAPETSQQQKRCCACYTSPILHAQPFSVSDSEELHAGKSDFER